MKYFTKEELCKSNIADKKGIDNTPSKEIADNLELLVDSILDPLREAWGSCIRVTSGYRCEKLNTEVGGSKTSQHKLGLAADLQPCNNDMKGFVDFVIDWLKTNNIQFDQCILEKPRNGIPSWVHLSYGKRKQIFTIV